MSSSSLFFVLTIKQWSKPLSNYFSSVLLLFLSDAEERGTSLISFVYLVIILVFKDIGRKGYIGDASIFCSQDVIIVVLGILPFIDNVYQKQQTYLWGST